MIEYKPIVGFNGYRIGSDGSVWKKKLCTATIAGPRRNPLAKVWYSNYSWVLLDETKDGCVNLHTGKKSANYVKRRVADLMRRYFPNSIQVAHECS